MSSFYDDASLVVIPSGYKTSKVYAEKPTDGSGDLAFTRTGDTATRVASNGLIEKVRTNSLLNSQNFSAWTLFGAATRTTGVVDPNGGTTAATISNIPAGNLTDGIRLLSNPISASTGNPIRFSIYLKGSGTIRIAIERSLTGDYFYYPVVVTLTSTWTRYEVGGNTGNSTGAGVYVVNATGTTATSVDVAFGQIEIGDVATAYIPTTTAAVSVGPVANVPRLDYLGSTCPRLLLEPQRTNLITFSEQFDNAGFFKQRSSITPNTTTAPDGTMSADTFEDTNLSVGSHFMRSTNMSAVSGTVYSTSFFVKAGTSKRVEISLRANNEGSIGAGETVFNLDNGTIVSGSGSITAFSNGWYRCTSVGTSNSTTLANAFIYLYDSLGNKSYTGTGTNTVFIWGLQIEAGAYPTTYIPTLAASATRGADACSKTGISSLIGQTEGTALLDFQFNGAAESIIMDISATGLSPQNRIILYQPSGTIVQFIVLDNSVSQVNLFSSNYTIGQRLKVAIAYKANSFAFYINGVQIGTDNSGTVPATSRIDIGNRQDAAFPATISVNQTLLFKTRLTNAELATLTTL